MITAMKRSSSPDLVADVVEFHRKFGQEYVGPPRALPEAIRDFRIKFLREELDEYATSSDDLHGILRLSDPDSDFVAGGLADQIDALVDLVYVAIGNAHLQGFDFSEAWRRVHRANMAKVRAAEDGSDSRRGSSYDVVKPPGWIAPDHHDLVASHAHRGDES